MDTRESGQGVRSAGLTWRGLHQQRAPGQSAALLERSVGEGASSSGPSTRRLGEISPWRPFLEQGEDGPCQEPGSCPVIPQKLTELQLLGVERRGVSLEAGAALP